MQLNQKDVYQAIIEFFSQKGQEVTLSTKLIEDGILDSMEIVEFIMFLEEKFGVEFCPTSFEIYNFKSIEKLISSLKVI
jgi:acyl carrier protein